MDRNWHDCMRLVLLRCLGRHRRDVRRLLVGYCERAHGKWLAQEWYWPTSYTFHQMCNDPRAGYSFSCMYYDAACVEKHSKNPIRRYKPEEMTMWCGCRLPVYIQDE